MDLFFRLTELTVWTLAWAVKRLILTRSIGQSFFCSACYHLRGARRRSSDDVQEDAWEGAEAFFDYIGSVWPGRRRLGSCLARTNLGGPWLASEVYWREAHGFTGEAHG